MWICLSRINAFFLLFFFFLCASPWQVVFLDDDVVVQRDLAPLFTLDLHSNVNGAVETCLESFHRFHKYLNFSHPKIKAHFDPDACGWAFGMNVFDLVKWREKNVTARYYSTLLYCCWILFQAVIAHLPTTTIEKNSCPPFMYLMCIVFFHTDFNLC